MRHETTRRLPVTLPPIHHETIGSYLHRLAVANNRPARKLASLLGPLPSDFTPASDTTAGWTRDAPQHLASLAGRPLDRLAKALPGLASFLDPSSPRPSTVIGRPCRCCTARRGATTLVITYIPAHQHLCRRHQRWTRAPHDIPLTSLPDVVAAQRRLARLARRHDAQVLTGALDLAQAIVCDWSTTQQPDLLQQRWKDRLVHVEVHHAGQTASPQDRHRLVSFPETVVLADLLLGPPHPATNARTLYLQMAAELGRRFALTYPILGTRDPLYRRFCKRHID
jgi:hypothetical protein